jgi:hypothetical protein
MLAAGTLDAADYEDHTEGIVTAALATPTAVARAGPTPDESAAPPVA